MASNRNYNRAALRCESLEARDVPAAFPIAADAVAITPDDGGIPVVHLVSAKTGAELGQVQAYEDSFRGGVHAALGDVTGDGVPDLVLSSGRGGGPRVRVIDGQSGQTLRDFFVYEPQFTGGIYVALGDVNGDGRDDIITGTGSGGGPRVRVLDGASLGATVLTEFMAYEDSFRGGVLVAAGDTDGDGRDDVICGTGPTGGPVVHVFSGADGRELASFLADDARFRGGVRVDARDVNGDGRDDVIAHLRHGNDDGFRVFSGDGGRFMTGSSRVVDDNPSPDDGIDDRGVAAPPGTVSSVEGTLVSVDAGANTVSIRLQTGAVQTIQAGPGTEVKRDEVRVALTAFQAGDKVEAVVGADGVAWEIEAKSPAFVEGSSGRSGSGDTSGSGTDDHGGPGHG